MISDWYDWEIFQEGKSFGRVAYFNRDKFVQEKRISGIMNWQPYEFKLRRLDLDQETIDRLLEKRNGRTE